MTEQNSAVQNSSPQAEAVEAPKEKPKGKYFALYFGGMVFALAGQCILLLIYIFGAVDFFGMSVNPLSAVEAIISVFSLRRAAVYRYLIRAALGVLYLGLFVPLIKVLVERISSMGKALKNKTDAYMRSFYLRAKENFFFTVWLFLFFNLFACLFARGQIGGGTVVVYILLCVFCLYDGIVSSLGRPQMGRAEIVLSACKNTAAAVLFCILDRMLAVPSGENIFDGMAMLFGGYLGTSGGGLLFVYGLVSNLVEPILICIMALWTVILLKNYFVAAPRERIASMRALLIYCAIVTFLVMLFKTGISYNNAKMFFSEGLIPDWFRAVRNLFLPFTFGIAGLFAVEMICLDRKKEKFSAASVKH